MIDLNLIRKDISAYKKICEAKNKNINIDEVLSLDDKRKELQGQIDDLKFHQKEAGKNKDIEKAKSLKTQIQTLEEQYSQTITNLHTRELKLPNIIHPKTPIGKSEAENIEAYRKWKIPEFDFPTKDHMELMQKHDMIDVERGVKLSWARSYFLKNDGALLEQAILQYAYKKMISKWFTPMMVPNIVSTETLEGTWYFPGWEEDTYQLERDDKRLIATAEIPLTGYHAWEILDYKELPKTYVGLSPCYRREAGSYGKDTAGLYRVHQFSKVEQVIILPADIELSNQRHEKILTNATELLDELGIPYRKLDLCTGDMSIWKYRTHDLECRMPSRNNYGETHSASSFLDFQARRLKIRYRDQDWQIKFVYTLNNTVVATPRILIAVIENNQTADGKIKIPKILQAYMGKEIIG